MEVSVHLAWRSTLYVTNFPEKTDDAIIRDLFGQVCLLAAVFVIRLLISSLVWSHIRCPMAEQKIQDDPTVLLCAIHFSSKWWCTSLYLLIHVYDVQASAERALELHGRELEPNRTLSVYISNPGRKKERTDADANEREVYVAGLSRFTTKEDLEGVFSRVRVLISVSSLCYGR
jgi:hypothetical protein